MTRQAKLYAHKIVSYGPAILRYRHCLVFFSLMVNFSFSRPAAAKCCTDQGEIWQVWRWVTARYRKGPLSQMAAIAM